MPNTKTHYNIQITGKDETEELIGDGIIVGDYVITVAHIVSLKEAVVNTPFGEFNQPIGKISERTYIGETELERIIADNDRDIAVLRLPKDYKKPAYKIKLADSDTLKLIEGIYLIGNMAGIGLNIREGVISNSIGEKVFEDQYRTSGFNVSTSGFYGDSGNPVINLQGEVIGLFAQLHFQGRSSFVKPINWFKEYMK